MTEILGAAYNGMLLLFLLAVVAALLRSPLVKGWFGEAQSALAQELLLDKAIYTGTTLSTLKTLLTTAAGYCISVQPLTRDKPALRCGFHVARRLSNTEYAKSQ